MFGSLPTLPLALFGLGAGEMIVILCVLLLLFGAKRLPELARGLGKSLSEFKKASKEAENEIRQSIEEQPKTPPPTKPSGNIPPATNS